MFMRPKKTIEGSNVIKHFGEAMITDDIVNDFYNRLIDTIINSDKMAYRYFGENYTYKQMYSQMIKINSVLSKYKHKQVLLYTKKSFFSYSAIFSIILSNNTWVPISPDMPELRNLEIIKQASPGLVLYGDSLPNVLKEFFANKKIPVASIPEILSEGDEREFGRNVFKKDDIAYIMFTSGSTGIPKGVAMTHENYINFVNNVLEILPFEEGEVFSDFHDFAFDISIFYLFACVFIQGAFSPIIEQKDKIMPIRHILENRITVWSCVPSIIKRIKEFRPNDRIISSIRIMFLCGEPLKLDVLRYCFENMALDNVFNFYGLTETGVENFWHRCSPEDLEKYADFGMAPIGRPLPGNYIEVTKDKELCIGGCQVAKGYLGGRSPEKFVFKNGMMWCKTGDIVEEHGDVYLCKGRLDSQVKLSGHRVELMDIEAHIIKLDKVDDAVCFVERIGDREFLVAALKARERIDAKTIQNSLKKELPVHMIPKDIFYLDKIPLNENGKTNRGKVRLLYREKCNQVIGA